MSSFHLSHFLSFSFYYNEIKTAKYAFRVECAEIERKAAAKHEEINNGRKDVLEKLETLANEKKVHIDEHKAITKLVIITKLL